MPISLSVNGIKYTVDPESDTNFYSPTTSLAEFIRNKTPFTDVRISCNSGGCGACQVQMTFNSNVTQQPVTRVVNSCLTLLWSLNGAAVTTNSGFGNTTKGLSDTQKTLAENGGFQCSFCSSGMVSLLSGYLKEHPQATSLELQELLDGSICRCGAYAGITKTFAQFGSDHVPTCMKENCCQKRDKAKKGIDVEDCSEPLDWADVDVGFVKKHAKINATSIKKKHTQLIEFARKKVREEEEEEEAETKNDNTLPPSYDSALKLRKSLESNSPGVPYIWQDCSDLQQLASFYSQYKDQKVHIIKNATSFGIYDDYRLGAFEVFLHLNDSIQEMQSVDISPATAKIGANCTIKDCIEFFKTNSTASAPAGQREVLSVIATHFVRIAGTGIRNRASIGGNLALCKKHSTEGNSFPSDAAIALLGAEAQLVVFDLTTSAQRILSLQDYYDPAKNVNAVTTIILQILIPMIPPATTDQNTFFFKTYKIAIRQVLDHAIVNAAFSAQISKADGKIQKFVCAIGGCFPAPTRVAPVEQMLVGADPSSSISIFQSAAAKLASAVSAGIDPTEGKVQFRIQTVQNYLYKFFLTMLGDKLPVNLKEASQQWLTRSKISTTTQSFGPGDEKLYPVGMAMPKLDADNLACGEAQFTSDKPVSAPATVYAAPVLTTQANAPITSIDKGAGAVVPGFVQYFDQAPNNTFNVGPAVLFCGNFSDYASQLVGIAVAGSQSAARLAAKKIQESITYGPVKSKLILTVDDCVANKTFFTPNKPDYHLDIGDAKAALAAPGVKVFSDTVYVGGQYHVHLENHVAVVTPVENGYEVEVATQAVSSAQEQVAKTLNVPASSVFVTTRRAGGGFGAKVTGANYVSAAAAVAAQALRRPCKMDLTLQEGAAALGARSPYRFDYTIGVDANNKIVALTGTMYLAVGTQSSDCGFEPIVAVPSLDNATRIPNATVSCFMMRSDVKPNTSVRGPGWVSAQATMEQIINHTARNLGVDPAEFRNNNLHQQGDLTFSKMPIETNGLIDVWTPAYNIYKTARQTANQLNAANRFYKRGVAVSAIRFPVTWTGTSFQSMVAIYPDGTVAITAGGTEIGQGIHVKLAQVCAYGLGLKESDLPTIRVLPNNTGFISNGNQTGGSITSELCALSVLHTCQELTKRLAPYRHEGQKWADLVSAALDDGADLTARGSSGIPSKTAPFRYNVFGAAVAQVDVDCLTGQFELRQVDLQFDVGQSLNPDIDLNQVEGGFFFGLGLFTMEKVEYDTTSGLALNANTWRYKPVTAYEIPETFNVSLLKNSKNEVGVLSSKACGEPPCALACSVVSAIEDAVNQARVEIGNKTPWACKETPLTVDKIAEACAIPTSALTF